MNRESVERFGRLEAEIQQERAAALRRIGGKLEQLIEHLTALRERLDVASDSQRAALVADYARLHEQARTYRWYLEVQREAVGLRRHDRLDEVYPIPPPLG